MKGFESYSLNRQTHRWTHGQTETLTLAGGNKYSMPRRQEIIFRSLAYCRIAEFGLVFVHTEQLWQCQLAMTEIGSIWCVLHEKIISMTVITVLKVPVTLYGSCTHYVLQLSTKPRCRSHCRCHSV